MNPTRWYAGVLTLLAFLSFGFGVWHSPQGASPPSGFGVPPSPGQETAPALGPPGSSGLGTPFSPITVAVTQNGGGLNPPDGGQFGPNTPGTQTGGILEAINSVLATFNPASASAFTVYIGPGRYQINASALLAMPIAAAYLVGIEICGAGNTTTTLVFNAGAGIVYPNYAFDSCYLHDIQLTYNNSGTATSMISIPNGIGGNIADYHIYNTRIQCPATGGPSNGWYYCPTASGNYLYLYNCSVVASCSCTVGAGQFLYVYGSQWGEGTSVGTITAPNIFFLESTLVGAFALGTNVALFRGTNCQWTPNGATSNGAVLDASNAPNGTVIDMQENNVVNSASTVTMIGFGANTNVARVFNNVFYIGGSGSGTFAYTGGTGALALGSTLEPNYEENGIYSVGLNFTNLPISLAANPPVSGTQYQNPEPFPIIIYQPVTLTPTAGAAATCVAQVAPDGNFRTLPTMTVPAGTALDSFILIYTLKVRAHGYYKFTVVNATLGTAVAMPDM